jgi:hypothetical protein
MKKEIRVADEEKGLIQITTYDERWYAKPSTDEKTQLPAYKFVPSVTWVCSFFPKDTFFYKWLAEKGWDEAEAIKIAAGDKGSKVHLAVADIMLGKEVRIDSKYPNRTKGYDEELTIEEVDCIMSYQAWLAETELTHTVETVAFEVAVFSDTHNFAGTIDFIAKLTNKATQEVTYWLIDFKTGQSVWFESKMQVSAYRETLVNGENGFPKLPPGVDIKLGILQLGYRMNKKRFKFNVITPCFDEFLIAKQLWEFKAGKQTPSEKDYPVVISAARGEYIVAPVEEVTETTPNTD